MEASVATGNTPVVSFGVAWVTRSGAVPSATSSITMTVTDPNIVAGDGIYKVTSSGSLEHAGTAMESGSVTLSFTSDPTFVTSTKGHSPAIRILSASVKLIAKSLVAPVKLSCSTATCTGTVKITETTEVMAGKKTLTKTYVLASASYKLAKAKSGDFTLKPTATGRTVLARAASNRPLHEVLTVTVGAHRHSEGRCDRDEGHQRDLMGLEASVAEQQAIPRVTRQ